MKFLALGNQQLQMWDNTQWENRIEVLKSQKQQRSSEQVCDDDVCPWIRAACTRVRARTELV